jgi:hypothetical protein
MPLPGPADVGRPVLALIATLALLGCGSFNLVAPTPPPQIVDGFIQGGLRFVTPAELGPGTITREQALAAAGDGPPRADRELPLLGVYAAWKEVQGPVIPRPPSAEGEAGDPAVGVAHIEEVPVWVVVYGWSSGEVFEIALVDARSGRLVVDGPLIHP